MVVEAKNLRKFLQNKRAGGAGDASNKAERTKNLVAAAANLLPLPWDAMLGYGNPGREVRLKRLEFGLVLGGFVVARQIGLECPSSFGRLRFLFLPHFLAID